jgi:non-canonical poly(A) RNA polymerase PAPD5/7
MHKSIEV